MLALLRDLVAHSEWADAHFFRAWEASPARDHEELRRRVDHILVVQRIFLALLRGKQPAVPPQGPPPMFAELKTSAQAGHAGLCNCTAALEPESLSRTVLQPFFPDPPCVVTFTEAIVQVAMHSQHHRGQCMTRLKDFGGEPVNVDWIIWLWRQKPPARWD